MQSKGRSMENSEINDQLTILGVATEFSDSAQGRFGWINVTTYDTFNKVVAIRAGANWDVVGVARDRSGHELNMSISIDEGRNSGRLAIGLAVWEFGLGSQDIKVMNSASTGELMIRFAKSVGATQYREPITMSMGSYIVIKDANL